MRYDLPMEPIPRATASLRREVLTALAVALTLGAAADALALHRATASLRHSPPAMDTLRGCLVAAALYACARRWPRLRGAATLALLATAPLLPAWNAGTLHWLGETLVGGWGDGVWNLTAPQLYVGELRAVGVHVAPAELRFAACVAVALAAVLFARTTAALLARPATRSATLLVLLAIPAALTAQGAITHVTRAPFSRWWTAYPVVARVPAWRGPTAPDPARTEPCLLLTHWLCASRLTDHHYNIQPIPLFSLPFTPPGPQDRGPLGTHLWCPAERGSLVVRTVAQPDRHLVACEDPRTGLLWTPPDTDPTAYSLVNARGYFAHVYTAEALAAAAPPPGVTVAAALGVLIALATLARRHRTAPASPLATPYRAAPDADVPATNRSLALAGDAFAVALAVQSAAPLVLAAWSRLAVFR